MGPADDQAWPGAGVRCGAVSEGAGAAGVGSAGRVRGALRRSFAPGDVRRSRVGESPVCLPMVWPPPVWPPRVGVFPVRLSPVCAFPGCGFRGCVPPGPGPPEPEATVLGPGCCTSRRQVAATTARAVLPPVAVVFGVAENPSAEPVFTLSALAESRLRDRWTVGVSGPVAAEDVGAEDVGVACPPPVRFGPMLRMRTGAGGAAGEATGAPGAGVPVPVGVRPWGRSPSTARCTGAGAERTGIPEGVPGEVGGAAACWGALCGAGVSVGPGWVRRRSPRSGASGWSRAVDGSEVRGVPIPPRVRAREPEVSPGCAGPGALGC